MKYWQVSLLFLFLFATMSFSQVPSYVPTSGLVGYWPFNGNANDESGNGNNGVVNGAALSSDRFGSFNSAYSFNGSNNFISITNSSIAAFGNQSFTCLVWFKRNGIDGNSGEMFVRYDNCVSNSGWGLGFGSNYRVQGLEFPASRVPNYVESIASYNNNQWVMAVFVRDVLQLKNLLYVNGAVIAQTSFSAVNLLSNTGSVLRFGSCGGYQFYSGILDEIGIWNRALTQQEITNLYTSTVPPTTAVLSGDATICAGASTNLSVAVTGGTSPYTVTVTDGTNNYSATGASPVSIPVSPTATSTYSIVSVTGGGTGTGNTGTATVTVTPNTSFTSTIAATDTYTWANNGQTYTTSGIYTGNVVNCVVQVLNLTITPDPLVSQLRMDLEWICSTTNTADFQIRVTNTGTTPITFNALIIRGVHAPNITTGTITFQALNNNTLPGWLNWPNTGTTNLPYISSQRKLNFSSATSIFTNVTAPLIPSGSVIVVGTFRMLTTTTWVPNSDFGFVWEATSGGIVGYVNGGTSVTGIQHYGITGGSICGQCLTVTASSSQPLNLSAPTTAASQNFCSAATVSDLSASPLYTSPQNATILWYNSQTGGTALNPTTLITSGTYYAAQMVNGCESARTAVAVSVIPVEITASDPLICQGETVSLSIPQSGSSNTICAALPANLQNGLVGYWPFCGNANDESGNGNNGTVNGATLTTDRFGNANNAYSFDGLDDWIDISTGFFNNGWNEMSINLWFNSSSNIATSGPGQTFLNTSPHNGIGIGYSYSGNQKIYVFKNSNPASSSWDTYAPALFNASSIPLNTWHNISIVKSGLTYQFYFDGQLDNTLNTSTVALNYFCNLRFGAITCCNPEVFNGKLDDISIFSRSLSLSEIQQIYNLEQITYLWSNGATTPTINVSPNNTTTYTCTATNNGESCTSNYTITVNNSSDSTVLVTACDSYTWLDGNTYTTANNTATFTTTNAAGCDSIITLNLTITPSTSNTTPISACGTYTWANNGQTYTASGTYTGATVNCVTEILDLTITPSTTNTTTTSACGTYTWANNGQTYTASGIYLGAITNCITEILNLTITPSTINTTLISSCGSYTWLNNSQTYTTSGIYSGTTANCVTETLNLTITPNSTNTTSISACGIYTWLNNGQTYTASGTYIGTTTNCVTQTIDLTIIPSTTNTTPISACGAYTWSNNGQTYTTSGIYSGTTANCISETLNLTITPSTTNTTPISACGTYTWANNGQTYTTSGVFNGTTTNCITQVLNLNITPISSFTTTISECDTYTWANNGQTYTASGVFNGTVINCVLQVLDLGIIDCISDSDNDGLTDYEESFLCTNPSLFDTDGDGISDGDENAQGSDPCDPCSPDINSGNCILGIHIPTAFSPNNSGFSENNVYQIIAGQDIAKIDFKIIDRWGKIIFESEDKKFQWDGSYRGQICNNGVYAYFIDVSYSNGKTEKLSGNITLIR